MIVYTKNEGICEEQLLLKTSPKANKMFEFGEVLGRVGLMEVYFLSVIDDNMVYFLSPINDKMMMLISIRLNFR